MHRSIALRTVGFGAHISDTFARFSAPAACKSIVAARSGASVSGAGGEGDGVDIVVDDFFNGPCVCGRTTHILGAQA
jgi:hypothetical protein